jgi:peptidoglycan/LPS O-acetylase OafA/YrhL
VYLVHWPILVLPAATLAVGEELPIAVRVALAALSVVVG